MEDREDIHAVVKLLVARMQSNPEEFKFNPTGSLAITGRWERWIAQLGWHFNEAEKELIYGKAKELIFNRVHEEVMEELINGSDRKIEVPINTTSALQRQQAAMQLAQAQIYNGLQNNPNSSIGWGAASQLASALPAGLTLSKDVASQSYRVHDTSGDTVLKINEETLEDVPTSALTALSRILRIKK